MRLAAGLVQPAGGRELEVAAALHQQRADRGALVQLDRGEALLGAIGVKEREGAGDRRHRMDGVREAGGGGDFVDELGASGEADQVHTVVEHLPGRLLAVDQPGEEEDVVRRAPVVVEAERGPAAAARQAVGEDGDGAHRLGRGDDAVVVLHHLRGVAAAAVERDEERMQGAGGERRRRVGADVALGAAVVEGLGGDRAVGRRRHRRAAAEILHRLGGGRGGP